MKLTTITLFWLGVFIVSAPQVLSRDWRGLAPLHSTRTDVVRLFNQCADRQGGCKFSVGNEDVYIVFSSGAMSEYHECARQLPTDTILLIEVELNSPLKLSKLRIDKKKFRTFDPSSPPNIGYKGYIDEQEGLILKTYKGNVLQLDYIAAITDGPLCKSYY